jgi:hypothetical protein
VHPVALAAGDLAHLVLLVAAGEVELGHIGAGIHLAGAEPDGFLALGDNLKMVSPGLSESRDWST